MSNSKNRITIMKELKFCAGHRLQGHGGKCENLHGHNYRIQIYVTGAETDTVGRLVDFSVIKRLFKGWFDEHWDHAMILAEDDQQAIDAIRSVRNRLYLLPYSPTAENMARYVLENVAPKLVKQIPDYQVVVCKVALWETESSCAEIELSTEQLENGYIAVENWQRSLQT